jgi:hypothetical protein
MVHVLSSLRLATPIHNAPKLRQAAADTSASSETPDFRALFTSVPTPVTAAPTPPPASPTAESVFGANPWMTNPTGTGPDGAPFSYNRYYFATAQTAATVAQMVGGKVVQSNQFTPSGGPFQQQQPNYMVQLSDGRMINPGLVASFYTHGYPQSYVDMMVAAEVKNA